MTTFFPAYLRQFPAGKNIQTAGDIAGCWRLLTSQNDDIFIKPSHI